MEDNKNTRSEGQDYNRQVERGEAGGIRNEYTVEERDTLEDIAQKHGISIEEIMAANKDSIQNERDMVQPGTRLMIPRKLDH
jgi:LysM repeat protein